MACVIGMRSSGLVLSTTGPTNQNRRRISDRCKRLNLARFLLRDGNKVGADVSLNGLEIYTYTDEQGQQVHALASLESERSFLRQVPSKLLPLYLRMELALAKAVGRG